jgi:phosphate:Na+ symporter
VYGILLFLNLLGGLGVFLLGIKMMSDGLQKAAGDKLRGIISGATSNRFTATLSGFVATSIIQSSSATTVMVVGFASAGLLTLSQSLGVIFGANIGTTTTAWIISLLGFKVKITLFALPMIGVGFFSQFIEKWPNVRRIGEAMLGFGLLFLGLSLIQNAIPDVKDSAAVVEWATKFRPENIFKLLAVVGVGTVFTLIFQSSSAVMALTLTLAAKGLIDYPTAAALVLGENIGTTITANIAAIGATRTAKRAALGHLMFNVLGVIWAIILFKPLMNLVDFIIPGSTTGSSPEVLLTSIPYHLSAFHTTFNVINTCVMLIFIKQFEKIIMFFMPIKKSEEKKTDLVYLKTGFTTTPELSLQAVKMEADRMAGLVESITTKILHAIKTDSPKLFDRAITEIINAEKASDILEFKINEFLKQLAHGPLSRDMVADVLLMLDITNQLEKMADNGQKIAILLDKAKKANYFYQQDLENLETIGLKVKKIVKEARFTILNYNKMDKEEVLKIANEREQDLNDTRHKFRDEKSLRDYSGEQGFSPVSITMYADILNSFEKIGDYALNMVEATTGARHEAKAALLAKHIKTHK